MFKISTTNKQLGLFTTASSLMCKSESKQYEDEKTLIESIADISHIDDTI